MAIDVGASGLVPRTPAWRKLGLQLKSALDGSNGEELNQVQPASSGSGPKRKRSSGAEHEPHGSQFEARTLKKTRRLAPSQSPVTISHPHNVPTRDGALKSKRGRKKVKSVSFTADTKSQDGDSAKRLFDAWLEKEQASDPGFRPEKVSEALTVKDAAPAKFPSEAIDGQITQSKAKKRKKENKKANLAQKGSEAAAPSPGCHPALTYLLQYSQARGEWKFNKAKQSYILKHLLHLDRIPSEHERALCSYVTGLQVEAVRARVRRSMECVKTEELFGDSEGSSTDEAEKRARQDFEQALTAFVDGLRKRGADVLDDSSYSELYPTDEDLSQKLKRRKRAEAILWALSQSEDHGVDVAPGNPARVHPNVRANGTGMEPAAGQPDNINGSSAAHQRIRLNVKDRNKPQPKLKIRMRKLRTNAVDLESSGSSSSSSSESESARDDNGSDDGSSGSSSEATDSGSERVSAEESITSVSDSRSDSASDLGSDSSSGSGSGSGSTPDSSSGSDSESVSITDPDSDDSGSSTSSGDSSGSSAVNASDTTSGEDGSDEDSSRPEGAPSDASSISQTSSNSSGHHKTTGQTKRKL